MWQTHTNCHKEVRLSFLIITFGSDALLKDKHELLYHLLNLGACTRHLATSQFSPLIPLPTSNHSSGVLKEVSSELAQGFFFDMKAHILNEELCMTFLSGSYYCSTQLLLRIMS